MPPRVLLTSAWKPFAVDGIYGRKESKIEAPVTVLDYPSFERFRKEVIIGISSIVPNFQKAKRMVEEMTYNILIFGSANRAAPKVRGRGANKEGQEQAVRRHHAAARQGHAL